MTITENLAVSDRYIRIQAKGSTPEAENVVFVRVPCGIDGHEEHVLGFERADFYAMVQQELGLVDPLEELFAL